MNSSAEALINSGEWGVTLDGYSDIYFTYAYASSSEPNSMYVLCIPRRRRM